MRGRAHWSSYLHLCSSRLRCQSSASHEGNSKIRTILPPWDFDLGAGSRVWWQTPSILALRKFETGMVYIVSSRATWATQWDTVSEKAKKEKEKIFEKGISIASWDTISKGSYREKHCWEHSVKCLMFLNNPNNCSLEQDILWANSKILASIFRKWFITSPRKKITVYKDITKVTQCFVQ